MALIYRIVQETERLGIETLNAQELPEGGLGRNVFGLRTELGECQIGNILIDHDPGIDGHTLSVFAYKDGKGLPARVIVAHVKGDIALRMEKKGDRFYLHLEKRKWIPSELLRSALRPWALPSPETPRLAGQSAG